MMGIFHLIPHDSKCLLSEHSETDELGQAIKNQIEMLSHYNIGI